MYLQTDIVEVLFEPKPFPWCEVFLENFVRKVLKASQRKPQHDTSEDHPYPLLAVKVEFSLEERDTHIVENCMFSRTQERRPLSGI